VKIARIICKSGRGSWSGGRDRSRSCRGKAAKNSPSLYIYQAPALFSKAALESSLQLSSSTVNLQVFRKRNGNGTGPALS
jgi:hypothetical protein